MRLTIELNDARQTRTGKMREQIFIVGETRFYKLGRPIKVSARLKRGDLIKAFNRVSHQMVIEDLHDMHVPSWLLLILISYLTERTMILTYNGSSSSSKSLPGSSPQGAFLGIFFFIVKYNGAALRPIIPRIIFKQECRARYKTCKIADCIKHARDMHALYIDDLSEAEVIELKKKLISDPVQRPFPLNYHERTQHILPAGSTGMQQRLDNLENFTIRNQMKINESKSKVMLFNKSRKFDFPPEFSFQNGEVLECVEKTKLLGIFLTPNQLQQCQKCGY